MVDQAQNYGLACELSYDGRSAITKSTMLSACNRIFNLDSVPAEQSQDISARDAVLSDSDLYVSDTRVSTYPSLSFGVVDEL